MLKYLLPAALICSLAFVAFVTSARAAEAEKKLASKDEKFIRDAATGNEMEVALGKLASTKGAGDDVKKFGQQMVDDHSKSNDELKQLAQSKGVDLTKAEDAAMKKESKEETSLSKKEGSDFDKAYMKMMVKDHEKDVKEFEKASKDCEDSEVKAWAGKTLPTLQSHLSMAKEIEGKLK
jgi:putative membrane protein